MKKLILSLLLFNVCILQAQNNDTIAKPMYYRVNFVSLTSDSNDSIPLISDRIMQNIEIGKSLGIADVGVSLGAISVKNLKKTSFIEGKANLDTYQVGIFSNEVSLGVGYVFNSPTPIMLELSSTIFCQVDDNWGLGVVYGYDSLIGDYREHNLNFFGLYLRFGLLRDDGGIVTNKFKKRNKPKRGKRIN